MFSGLTNQVTSWMGTGKDEEVPQPAGGGAVAIDEQVDPSLASGAGISAGIEATGDTVGADGGDASRYVRNNLQIVFFFILQNVQLRRPNSRK